MFNYRVLKMLILLLLQYTATFYKVETVETNVIIVILIIFKKFLIFKKY